MTPTSFILIAVSLRASFALSFDTMEWKAGDVISCPLPGLLGLIGNHVMMAVNETRVVHVIGNRVLLQERHEVCEGAMVKSRCKITGSYGVAAVDRAMSYVGVCVPYHLWTCNCQHYVVYWARGQKPAEDEVDSLSPPSPRCLRTDVQDTLGFCPNEVNAYTTLVC